MAELCFAGKIALVNLDNKKVDFHELDLLYRFTYRSGFETSERAEWFENRFYEKNTCFKSTNRTL